MSYTPDQRQWYLQAYDETCAFPIGIDGYGWSWDGCGRTPPLEIHHLLPSAWIKEQLPYEDPNSINFSLGMVGIALCRRHHHLIHPDVGKAFSIYHLDKGAIREAVNTHSEMAKRGEKFWEDKYDGVLLQVAAQAVLGFASLNKDYPYPPDKKWRKNPHPRKPVWRDDV